MTAPFTERTGKRVLLSTLTLPAPARWPYLDHRSMAEVMAAEQSTVDAVHSFVTDATLFGVCATKDGPESQLSLQPGPDQLAMEVPHGS